jgi:hypothetical protein
MLSFFDLGRPRRAALPARCPAKRPSQPRRPRLFLETLEDRCVPAGSFIASSFNSIPIAPGNAIWFSSVANVMGVGITPATIHVTNQVITFNDSLAGNINVTLPDADLTLSPGATSASTTFDSTSSKWTTSAPTGLAGNEFLSGYELPLPSGLHGSNIPVTWSAQFTADTPGLSLNWQWAAAVYTSFGATYGSLGVKPVDSSTASSYLNSDHAGSPEGYKFFVTGGARGAGSPDYTGSYSSSASVIPTYTPTRVTLAGTVYEDAGGNGVYGAGDTGIGGVTLVLTGTPSGGGSVTATTTTAADGSYTFTTDTSGNLLGAGTYQITETKPAGYLLDSATVGTVNGNSDGMMVSATVLGSVALAAGQNGINYNFGLVRPITLGGTVYEDNNDNSVFDTGDTGISGVTLTLGGTNNLGQSVTATTTTAADGSYTFTTDTSGNLLAPGTYQVTLTQPSGYLAGAANVGTVNGASNGTAASRTQIGSIVMPEGQSGINYNFGQVVTVSVSGYVYVDSNRDTIKDNGETGDSQPDLIQLTGTDMFGNAVNLTTTTDATGFYSFTALVPGTYTITFVSAPASYNFETANVGTVNGLANGQMAASNSISQVQLNSGSVAVDYDFAEVLAGS